jgi:hypothetical protein
MLRNSRQPIVIRSNSPGTGAAPHSYRTGKQFGRGRSRSTQAGGQQRRTIGGESEPLYCDGAARLSFGNAAGARDEGELAGPCRFQRYRQGEMPRLSLAFAGFSALRPQAMVILLWRRPGAVGASRRSARRDEAEFNAAGQERYFAAEKVVGCRM